MPERLQVGMTMDEVRHLLRGWREGLPSAFLSHDKTHLYYSVEYTPPEGSDRKRERLTFDNGRLLQWSDAAEDTAPGGKSV
jgi:hypothetical protein